MAAFKSRFLKAYLTWLQENRHPTQPASSSRRSSTRSPASSTQGHSPASNTAQLPPVWETRARPPIQGTPWGEHGRQPPPPRCQYEPLKQHLLQQHQHVNIHPFIIGSLGSWYPKNDRVLSALRIGHRYVALMRRLCVVSAIAGSQNIWYQAICKSHRRGPPTEPDPQPTAAIGGPAMAAPHRD